LPSDNSSAKWGSRGVSAEKKSVSKKTTLLVSRSRLRTRRVYGRR